MTWLEEKAALAKELISPEIGFGEPVTLPSGEVQAIVYLPVGESESQDQGSRAGARVLLDHQVYPQIHLRTEDAGGLQEQDPVTVRGTQYLVVSLHPDGEGMTAVALMLPGQELGSYPEYNRWR